MIQIAVLAVSVMFVVLGVKGFTQEGLRLSKTTVLRGRSGKIVGSICIFFGIIFIPLFILLFVLYGKMLGG